MDRTRQRITRAAVELHGTIGPAATTLSAVAEKAGVSRATLYRHFPNEESLFTACSADWLAANPPPDPARWAAIAEPERRLAAALDDVYGYYRSTAAMRANLLRDIDALPSRIAAGVAGLPDRMRAGLAPGGPDDDGPLARAALGHAFAFETWRSLVQQGLDDVQAANLMATLIEAARDARKRDRIVLVGMMGSGKTTIGRELARITGWPLVDNDDLVRRRTGREPAAIAAEDGEDALHEAEAAAFGDALRRPMPLIVGVAGAMVERPAMREAIRTAGHVVWLRARPETLRARIGRGRHRRPEAVDPGWVAARASEREALYREVADQVIDVDEARPTEIAAAIVDAAGIPSTARVPSAG
ncbi:MAG TPA: shikimate kinase [Candidatus Limnocylindrales bacterium]|nr:shikimate kinase [Candidatus Limnocylindrales bacterium]